MANPNSTQSNAAAANAVFENAAQKRGNFNNKRLKHARKDEIDLLSQDPPKGSPPGTYRKQRNAMLEANATRSSDMRNAQQSDNWSRRSKAVDSADNKKNMASK